MPTVAALAQAGVVARLWQKVFGGFRIHEFKKHLHHHQDDYQIDKKRNHNNNAPNTARKSRQYYTTNPQILCYTIGWICLF